MRFPVGGLESGYIRPGIACCNFFAVAIPAGKRFCLGDTAKNQRNQFMHARKQAILTRSDPIPSLRLGIDTSKRKKWQRSIRQPTRSSQLPTTTWKRQRSFTCTHGNGTSPVSVSQPQLRALHGTSGVRSTVQAGHLTSRLPAANCCRMILKCQSITCRVRYSRRKPIMQ